MSWRKHLLCATLAAGLAVAVSGQASAATQLVAGFDTGQSSAWNLDYVNNGGGNASLYTIASGADNAPGAAAVRFSFFNDPALTDYFDLPALFTLNATVSSTPGQFDGATYLQTGVSGNLKFVYNGASQVLDGHTLVHGVTTLFSVDFTNAWVQGNGGVGGLALTVMNGGHATFNSSIYDFSGLNTAQNAYTLHLANVTPNFGLSGAGQALDSFKAHGAGEFQTEVLAVPEPASWALMILGFGGMGAILRRRQRSMVPTVA